MISIEYISYIITAICSLIGSGLGILVKTKNLENRLSTIENKVDNINDIKIKQGIYQEQIKTIFKRLDEIERKLEKNER